MTGRSNMFHLAVPVRDLDEATEYYSKLGRVARRNDHSIIVDFFGHQLVCHHSPENCPDKVTMYPRHFGIILKEWNDYLNIYEAAKLNNLKFFTDPNHAGFVRFGGKPEEHMTFFLIDPSNNLLEFKHYVNEEWIFAPANKEIK